MAPFYSPKTGEVFVRNFDQGVVETFGGTVQTVDGRRGYFISVVGATPMNVPIIFNNPEQVYENKIYPSFLVARDSIEPALQRWHSVKQFEYMAGVSGSEEVIGNVSGFSEVERKQQAWPFDLFYTLTAYARYEHEAIPMMKKILRMCQPYSKVKLIDSLGDERSYSCYAESGIQDISEYVDVSDRLKAYVVSVRIEGELDLNDPVVQSTVGSIVNNLNVL